MRVIFRKKSASIFLFVFLSATSAFGTAASANQLCFGSTGEAPEISALYLDDFGGWHLVGKRAWIDLIADSPLIFHVCSVNNAKGFLIAQNDQTNNFKPSKFSRFEWYKDKSKLFYCQQVFEANTATEAADFSKTPAANSSDANDKGCGKDGQFAWSQLILIKN